MIWPHHVKHLFEHRKTEGVILHWNSSLSDELNWCLFLRWWLDHVWLIIKNCDVFTQRKNAFSNSRKKTFVLQSLHMQNTSGMKAPMATKIGNMAEGSSFSYGSLALGPLGLRFLPGVSLTWSATASSSVSIGKGGNWGQSGTFHDT